MTYGNHPIQPYHPTRPTYSSEWTKQVSDWTKSASNDKGGGARSIDIRWLFDPMLHSSLLPQNLWTTNEKMGDPKKVREILVGMMDYFELYIYV